MMRQLSMLVAAAALVTACQGGADDATVQDTGAFGEPVPPASVEAPGTTMTDTTGAAIGGNTTGTMADTGAMDTSAAGRDTSGNVPMARDTSPR